MLPVLITTITSTFYVYTELEIKSPSNKTQEKPPKKIALYNMQVYFFFFFHLFTNTVSMI
jgi:hypothetical protein